MRRLFTPLGFSLYRLLWFLALCSLTLSACGAEPETGALKQMDNGGEIRFIDDDGVAIELAKPCERIISLYSAHTENLFALGAQDQVLGGHSTCVYPPEAAFLPTYDYTGDVEQIIAAQPDLVLIRPFIRRKVPDYVAQLESAGIPVVSLYPDSFDEFDDYIRKLALLSGTGEKAEELLKDFHSQIKEITELTSQAPEQKTVFLEATEINLRTVTPDSMAGRAIIFAGGRNLASDARPAKKESSIAEFGIERVLKHADDIDVYISQRGAMNAGGNLISIRERAGFDTIKAVRDKEVYFISEKLISSPTFRYVKGVREIARFLYPEIIDDSSPFLSDSTITKAEYAEILVRELHLPLYLPSSSKYYKTEHTGHTFGMFEDVKWDSFQFDSVETAVFGGYIDWVKEGDKEFFYPEQLVTREDLAKTIFLAGDFKVQDSHTEIADLQECNRGRIIQILVDNGVFRLEDGCFHPEQKVSGQEVLEALKFVSQPPRL